MTRNFQIVAQLIGMAGQMLMEPASRYFGWSSELSTLLHALIGFGQAAMGILAHNFNPDGSRSA